MSIIKNHLLFNHTYLYQLQADRSIDDQASTVAQGVRDWYSFRDTTSTQNLVTSWVEPMLSLLELNLQQVTPAAFLLYTAYDTATPVGLCYVTPPGVDLDSTNKGSHWMAQAVLTAKLKSGGEAPHSTVSEVKSSPGLQSLRWVILTNGDQWRLLDAQSLRRYEAYLQVDLAELARDQSDLTALRIFYRCFHRTALAANGDNKTGLNQLLTESARATERAERHLKQQMEEVLGNLCRGFVAFDRTQGKSTYSEAERRTIFADATYLLYRILFIFYAESRGLLPVERADYRKVGMEALAKLAGDYKLGGIPDLNGTTLWDRLSYLCDAIYGAEHEPENELGIPAYDGDLFDNANHPYLARATITDQYLTDALFDLAYLPIPNPQSPTPIDYRDLSVRHLGSMYEGMLEYNLFVAEMAMVARRDDKGNVAYLSETQAGSLKKTDQAIKPGEVYFSQSPGERKASGSYYTPEYIVDYIVQQTVWAGLSERRKPLEEQLTRWQSDLAGALDEAEFARLCRTIEHELLKFVEEQALTFRVCDPAMGSGHFLVNATLTIANFIVETLHLDFGFTIYDLRLAETQSRFGNPKSEILSDPAYWRRRLVERCIYGVDLNPLSVELAKLSLWLVTVERGKPLSFLNHHLRHGNSLVGTRLETLLTLLDGKQQSRPQAKPKTQATGQLSLFDDTLNQHLTTATRLLARIAVQTAKNITEVKAQAGDYEQARDELATYRQLADLLTARHLGLTLDESLARGLAKYLLGGAIAAPPAYQQRLAEAQTMAESHRFFHWELEFPELFFNPTSPQLSKWAGFQAVIGNPPYVRSEELGLLKSYFAANYPEVYHGTADLFVYFFGQGIRLLQLGGCLTYISSNSWLRANYAGPLRVFLKTKTTIEQLIDLGDNRVFEDAPDVYPAIPVVRSKLPSPEFTAQAAVFSRGEELAHFEQQVKTKLFPLSIHNQPDTGWQLEFDAVRGIFSKLTADGVPLGQVVNGHIYSGIKTGLTEAFVISQSIRDQIVQTDPSSVTILKPFLRGEDMRPWYQKNEGLWLILFPSGWTNTEFGTKLSEEVAWKKLNDRFPAICNHLTQFTNAARKRQDQGRYWWELRPCDYYAEFEKPKILWPDIAKFPRFSWDTKGLYIGNTAYAAVSDPWLLGFLTSRCVWFLISKTSISFGERGGINRYRLIDQYLRPIPIPDVPNATRNALGDLALAITEQAHSRHSLHCQSHQKILAELGNSTQNLNQKLTQWWELDFPTFRTEVRKVFKQEIPPQEHNAWATWLTAQQTEHQRFTAEIVRLETELNERVYELYKLTPAEIRLIEESTKYRYGEV